MTEEATFEFGTPDYYEELGFIREELEYQSGKLNEIASAEVEQSQLLATYVPQVYEVEVLFLGAFLGITVFRLICSFLGRVFNDTTKI